MVRLPGRGARGLGIGMGEGSKGKEWGRREMVGEGRKGGERGGGREITDLQ